MFTKETADGRAQVGIGTLIVFIAMVLVAAIAAGVLINTAGFLQSQAEATGEESTDLVSERIDVTTEIGVVDQDANGFEEIRIGVTGAAGADDIDLNETIIQAVGPEGQEILTLADGWDGDANSLGEDEFGVLNDTDDELDQEEAVISQDNGDLIIVLNPEDGPFGTDPGEDAFGAGDRATLDIVSPSGATTQSELRAPSLLSEGGAAERL